MDPIADRFATPFVCKKCGRRVFETARRGKEPRSCLSCGDLAREQYEEQLSIQPLAAPRGASSKPLDTRDDVRSVEKHSSVRRTRGAATQNRCSDIGNGERFAQEFAGTTRYSELSGRSGGWWHYEDGVWSESVSRARAKAQRLPDLIRAEANAHKDKGARHALASWADKCSATTRVSNALREAAPMLTEEVKLWEANPYVVGVANGVIDLKSGELSGHDPEHHLLHKSEVEYRRGADAPRWQRFLLEITGDDRDLIDYLQRLAGYWLSGDTSEQIFHLFLGAGRNGKTVFLEILQYVFGPYAARLSAQTLTRSRRQPWELADLTQKRLVVCSEPSGGSWDTQILKAMAGDEAMTVERKFGRPFEMKVAFKLVVVANIAPATSEHTVAFRERLQVVPFRQTFTGASSDSQLPSKLRAEASGILRWAVDGFSMWRERSLKGQGRAAAVESATSNYWEESDPVDLFVKRHCTRKPGDSARCRQVTVMEVVPSS